MASYTKQLIINTFIQLLNERPLDKITVKDIVAICGINRNTFYYHFVDIPSLVEEILQTEEEKVLLGHMQMEQWEESFITAARFALENKKAIYHIYHSVSRENFERYLNHIAEDVMTRFVDRVSQGKCIAPEDKSLIVRFYRSALSGMILDWLNSGMSYDPEQVIKRLGKMLEGNIEHVLAHLEK
jgi:AcrR family transcriptional regulator